jgi:MFS family permease
MDLLKWGRFFKVPMVTQPKTFWVIVLVWAFINFAFAIITPVLTLKLHEFNTTTDVSEFIVTWSIGFLFASVFYPKILKFMPVFLLLMISSIGLVTLTVMDIFFHGFDGLALIRLGMGIFSGFIFLVCNTILLLITHEKYKATALAIFNTASALAHTIGSESIDFTGVHGPVPFILSAIFFVMVTGAFLFVIKEISGFNSDLREAKAEDKNDTKGIVVLRDNGQLMVLFFTIPFFFFFIISFIIGATSSAYNNLLPLFGQFAGLSDKMSALLISIASAGGLILSVPIGIWGDKRGNAKVLAYCSILIAATSFLVLFFREAYLSMFCFFLIGGGFSAATGLALAHISKGNDPTRVANVVSLFSLTGKMGAIIGTVGVGSLMSDWGASALFQLIIGGCGITVLFIWLAALKSEEQYAVLK